MCVVVPMAATLAMTAAQGVVGYLGQAQQARSQAEYQNAVYTQQQQDALANAEYQNRQVERQNQYIQQNAENTLSALQVDREALLQQELQERRATSLDIQQRRIERLKAQGALRASARAGLSIDTLLSDYDRQASVADGIVMQNLAFATGQRQREQLKLTTMANSRINEARPYEAAPFQTPIRPQPVQGPSLLGTALGIGSGIAGTLQSRSVYDPTLGRYRIDTMRSLPSSMPRGSTLGPQTSFTSGFSSTTGKGLPLTGIGYNRTLK